LDVGCVGLLHLSRFVYFIGVSECKKARLEISFLKIKKVVKFGDVILQPFLIFVINGFSLKMAEAFLFSDQFPFPLCAEQDRIGQKFVQLTNKAKESGSA
jgi:hypothetical protein